MGDPVLHIQLRDWADLIVLAPLDANTMAKIAGGLCDNLLTCILRVILGNSILQIFLLIFRFHISSLVATIFYSTISSQQAWDMSKPVVFCPAMNTKMWEHPFTAAHVRQLQSLGYSYVPPVAKTLACGDVGG